MVPKRYYCCKTEFAMIERDAYQSFDHYRQERWNLCLHCVTMAGFSAV